MPLLSRAIFATCLLLCTALLGFAQTEGTQRWAFNTLGAIASSPAIATDGTIYTGVQQTGIFATKLFAINPNGTVRWQFIGASDWIDSSPTVGSDGTIYAGSWDGRLYALNANGTLKWWYAAAGFIAASPAIAADGTIYVGSGDSSLYAINPNGTLKWNFLVADWVDSSPSIGADGTVYFGCWDDNVYAVRADGTLRWQYLTGGNVTASPAIGSNGTVYVGSADGKFYALNGQTGALVWSFQTETNQGFAASAVIGANGVIYVGSIDGYLYALNGTTGAMIWRYNGGAAIYSSAAIRADGVLIFGANYNVVALNSSGTLRWTRPTGDYVDSSPVIATDGTIYVGSLDRKLYAIWGNGNTVASSVAWPLFQRDTKRNGRALVIVKSPATVTLSNLAYTYNGGAKVATVTTNPAGLNVVVTYNGGLVAPVNAGSYAVVATVDELAWEGSASGNLVIAPRAQTIDFTLADRPFTTVPIPLNATATSGLPVSFGVISGPAIVNGSDLLLTGAGEVTVRATQAGDNNYLPVPFVDQTITVLENFLSWRVTNFTTAELADPNVSGPLAIYGADGLSNLLKYALGLPPKTEITFGLPQVTLASNEWVFTYTRPAGLTDIAYAVEHSADLTTWSTTGLTHDPVVLQNEIETCRARLPAASGDKLFFRLRVTQ